MLHHWKEDREILFRLSIPFCEINQVKPLEIGAWFHFFKSKNAYQFQTLHLGSGDSILCLFSFYLQFLHFPLVACQTKFLCAPGANSLGEQLALFENFFRSMEPYTSALNVCTAKKRQFHSFALQTLAKKLKLLCNAKIGSSTSILSDKRNSIFPNFLSSHFLKLFCCLLELITSSLWPGVFLYHFVFVRITW